MKLRPFQRLFVREALRPGVDTAALSIPRGNGKSWLAAHILKRCMTPGDRLHVTGAEYLLCAGSIEQARLCFRFVRADLEPTGNYRFIDSVQRIGATDKRDNTRLRIMSSNASTAMGIVGVPLLVADEPGSWKTVGGQLMYDAIQTAMGKPGSTLRAIYIGTLAPATVGWWPELIGGGSDGSTYVQALKGDPKRWNQWREISRVNPLTKISATFRAKLIEERNKARKDSRLKARFLSYRLNVPTADEASTLLTVDDWRLVLARQVEPRAGRPVVAVDMGGGRAWSAAVALYRSGRIEALALAPGIPSLADQERRDRVPSGTYQRLHDAGTLMLADGLRIPPASRLWGAITARWGSPAAIVCDRFRLPDLEDAGVSCPIVPRVTRWSEASADIRALRSGALDGPFAVDPGSRSILTASLAVATVQNDDAGSVRLVKTGTNNNGPR